MQNSAKKYDWRIKRKAICQVLGIDTKHYTTIITDRYKGGMSGGEISEWLKERTNIEVDARSIQRMMKKLGVIRTQGDAFRNAVQRGRIDYEERDAGKWDFCNECGRRKKKQKAVDKFQEEEELETETGTEAVDKFQDLVARVKN